MENNKQEALRVVSAYLNNYSKKTNEKMFYIKDDVIVNHKGEEILKVLELWEDISHFKICPFTTKGVCNWLMWIKE